MTYPFAIFYTNDSEINKKSKDFLKDIENIHFFSTKNIHYSAQNNQKVTFYCFNEEQITYAKKHNFDFHICSIGDELFSDYFINSIKNNKNKEIFWFPIKSSITNNMESVIYRLNEINQPISISLNEFINQSFKNEFRDFVFKIHQNFINPIIDIEKSLMKDSFSEENLAIIQKNDDIEIKNIILGIFGDILIDNMDTFKKENIKQIFLQKCCLNCEHSNTCINKGFGYSMKKLNYNDCISYKLLGI